MLNQEEISVYLHLYYKSVSEKIILDLSKVYNGNIYISLNRDTEHNDFLLECAQKYFQQVNYIYVDNMGSDQWGFYKNYIQHPAKTNWVLYIHDKRNEEWLNALLNPFFQSSDKINLLINNKSIGTISALLHKNKIYTTEDLNKELRTCNDKSKSIQYILSHQTVTWLNVLLAFLSSSEKLNINAKEYFFCAGNVFLCRKEILDLLFNKIIIDDFFEKGYRADGNVEHAMERIYFILSEVLGFTNKYI